MVLRDEVLHRIGVARVGRDGSHCAVRFLMEFGGGFVKGLLLAAGNDDLSPLAQIPLRDSEANPARTASDDRKLYPLSAWCLSSHKE